MAKVKNLVYTFSSQCIFLCFVVWRLFSPRIEEFRPSTISKIPLISILCVLFLHFPYSIVDISFDFFNQCFTHATLFLIKFSHFYLFSNLVYSSRKLIENSKIIIFLLPLLLFRWLIFSLLCHCSCIRINGV